MAPAAGFINTIGLPEAIASSLVHESKITIGEYASVKRELASISAKLDSPKRILDCLSTVRAAAKRAEIEAARRGQAAPKIG